MKLKAFCKRHENCIWAFLMTGILFLRVVSQFDFYYDLNDDVLIKDILSGVYSGTPDGHTMQLLYPLSLLLSLLYRGLSIPVFGVFLVLCQFGSIYAIAYRSACCARRRTEKVFVLAAEMVFFAAAFGHFLVFMQYTVTAGMLGAAAIFWVLTGKSVPGAERQETAVQQGTAGGRMSAAVSKKMSRSVSLQFLRENIPALLFYWTAFCLRPEMALLLLPLAGVAGLCLWGREKQIFSKETISKYLTLFSVLLLGMGLLTGADSLAYQKDGWQAFRRFFDARTELYDYQRDFVENYEENRGSYEAQGVTKQQQSLLANYNFGVDDRIDEMLLKALSKEATARQGGSYFRKTFREALWEIRSHWFGKKDMPLNSILLSSGVVLFCLGMLKKRRHLLWQVPLCFAAGGALWGFLLLRDRPVDRVFYPLYLGQIILFWGLLALERQADQKETAEEQEGYHRRCTSCLLRNSGGYTAVLISVAAAAFVSLVQMPLTFSAVAAEYADREEINSANEEVMRHCRNHPHTLYLEDVYSTVSFSEKIWVDKDKPFNYDLMGGWLVKSPLTLKKLRAFGYTSMGEAIRSGRNVQLLTEDGSNLDWLSAYFESESCNLKIIRVGRIAGGTDIYQIVPAESTERIGALDTEN